MVNTKIRLIIFSAAKDGEALYSQQKKKDQEMTVAQVMNSLSAGKDGEALYSQQQQKRPGDDCGSGHELFITKFRLKLKKSGKTARPFRYDLNQIPYEYTVEVRNRFKGLDLIDRVPEELWTEVHDTYGRQGSRPSPWKRNAKKQNGCLGRPYK